MRRSRSVFGVLAIVMSAALGFGSPALAGGVIDGSDDSFQSDVLDSKLPVVAFFTASWCNPCRRMEPALVLAAKQLDGRAVVVRLDADQVAGTQKLQGITEIPTLELFRDGKPVLRRTGVIRDSELLAWIESGL